MRIFMLLTTFVLFTIKTNGQNITSIDTLIANLNKEIPRLMKQNNVPGMAVAVLNNGHAIYQQVYGDSDRKLFKRVNSQTGFNVGSISKLFTAIGIMRLVEEGLVDLDDPVEKYLTRWKLPASKYDKSKVTIRRLLNHTAGISVHGYPGFSNGKTMPTLEESLDGNNGPVRANEKVEIILEPNSEFKYSGGGFSILQLVIEEVTKMPFHSYMKKIIFKPLRMKRTSFKITQGRLNNSAQPYDKEMNPVPFEYFIAQGAAGLQTTLSDFILFADDILNNQSIISKKSLDVMIMPTEVSKGNYGLGFMILKIGTLELTGHAGSNTGWQSAFFIDFNNKSGLIMMTNGDLGKKILQNILRTWASWKYNL